MRFAKARGEMPTLAWLPCSELLVDHNYQRMIEGGQSQRLIRNIAEQWDWRLCATLTVSDRRWSGPEPGKFVIDGQHRLRGAELRGDIKALPCFINEFGSYEDEARCFVAMNSIRRQVTAIDRYHALIAAKDPAALRIQKTVVKAGFTVTRYSDATFWKPGEISFPDAVGRALARESRDLASGTAELALSALRAFDGAPLLRGPEIFAGLLLVINGKWGDDDSRVIVALRAHLATKRQAAWVALRDKRMVVETIVHADRAMAEVILQDFKGGVALRSEKARGQRRFETIAPAGRGVTLAEAHPAMKESRTLFPTTRADPEAERVFKSGHNSRKIGKVVEKGEWAGFPIFTLTLEERATCPANCAVLRNCYGNNMQLAHRFPAGPALEAAIRQGLADLADLHPDGFVIRLHVLGDFYSLAYVHLWQAALAEYPGLRVYGYTAHAPDSEIGAELLSMATSQWDRFAMRFSGSALTKMAALVIDPPATLCPDEAFICPAQKLKLACCAVCTLCWSSTKNVAFLKH